MSTNVTSTQPKRLQCRHILPEGRRCGSPCLRGEPFCYYHHTSRRPVPQLSRRRARQGAFTLPMPEDRAAVQLSIGEVLARIAANQLDPRRAGLLLYGLQIALQNLPKPADASASNKKQAQPQPQPHVEEIVLHPTHGPLAPEAEFARDPAHKTLKDILLERWAKDDLKPEVRAQKVTQPITLPNLQASTQPTSHEPSFWRSQNLRSRLTPTSRSTPNPCRSKTLTRKVRVGRVSPPHSIDISPRSPEQHAPYHGLVSLPPAFPATFHDFLGNSQAVEGLRMAIASGRLPHSIILAGPQGAGKYTLALMLTLALECERQPRELWSTGQSLASYCGVCSNCTRIASAIDLPAQVDAAVTAREALSTTDQKDTRVLLQPHPDVLILPPDPPQLLIKLGQVRTLIQSAQYLPAEAPRKVFLLTAASFMKEAANSLLKILEEPPAYAHLILCAENPGELLPTIRSRCALVRLGALPVENLEMMLADRRPEWDPTHRTLVARLAQGAAGRALSFHLPEYIAARADALLLLRSALADPDHTPLFKMTETYRAGAEGQLKTTTLLRTLGLLLEDLLLLHAGTPELVRNTDLRPELERLAAAISFAWIENASRGLDQVTSGMRRNLLRNLSLDAFAAGLAGSA